MEVLGLRGTGQPCCCSCHCCGGLWEPVIIVLGHLFGELQILLFPLSPLLHKQKTSIVYICSLPPPKKKTYLSPLPKHERREPCNLHCLFNLKSGQFYDATD